MNKNTWGGRMIVNKEIEFKTFITKEKYDQLIREFNLENNVFAQTNYYFDTEDTKLMKECTVLRIRQKGNGYKLTKKTRASVGADETHILLSKEKAQDMLTNGIDASIIDIPYQVKKVAELTTYRASTPYKDGTLFFDRSEYYGHIDYEIEYEVDEVEQGKKDFNDFLQSFDIPYQESIRKSKRAFDGRK